jgi:hypothetical protein
MNPLNASQSTVCGLAWKRYSRQTPLRDAAPALNGPASFALISYGVLWPAVFDEFVPYALGGTALLVIGQFAAAKLDFQHLPECWPHVRGDESENVVGYPGAGT